MTPPLSPRAQSKEGAHLFLRTFGQRSGGRGRDWRNIRDKKRQILIKIVIANEQKNVSFSEMRAILALTPCLRTSMERPFRRSLQPTCHNWPFSPHSLRAKKRAENLARCSVLSGWKLEAQFHPLDMDVGLNISPFAFSRPGRELRNNGTEEEEDR